MSIAENTVQFKRKFGPALRALRESRNLTQLQVAERLGVTNATVSGWETGKAEPDMRNVRPLADLFGMTVDELIALGEASDAARPILAARSSQDPWAGAPAPVRRILTDYEDAMVDKTFQGVWEEVALLWQYSKQNGPRGQAAWDKLMTFLGWLEEDIPEMRLRRDKKRQRK